MRYVSTRVTLSSQLPPATIPEYRALPASLVNEYLGDYKLGPGATSLGPYRLTPAATVRVFLFDGKPYLHLPGVGDVQMFPTDRDTFTVRVVQGVGIAFERAVNDDVTAVTLALGDHRLTATFQRPP